MAEYELKIALGKIGKKRLNFALYRGDDADQVLVTAKAPSDKMLKEMDKECGATKRILKGVCYFEGPQLTFATKNPPAPAWEKMISKVLKERKCSQFLPIGLRQLGAGESEEVVAEEGDGSTAAPRSPGSVSVAPPVAPAPAAAGGELKLQWDALKAALMPQLRVAIAAPETKEAVGKIVAEAIGKEKAGAYGEAIAIFQKLSSILKSPTGSTAASAPPPPVASAPPVPPAPPNPRAAVRPPKPGNLQAALNKLAPAIQGAVARNPGEKEQILRPVVEFQRQMKAKEYEEARETLRKLGNLLKTLAAKAKAGA